MFKVKVKKWCIYIAPFPCNMLKGALYNDQFCLLYLWWQSLRKCKRWRKIIRWSILLSIILKRELYFLHVMDSWTAIQKTKLFKSGWDYSISYFCPKWFINDADKRSCILITKKNITLFMKTQFICFKGLTLFNTLTDLPPPRVLCC